MPKREPSIHITERALRKLIYDWAELNKLDPDMISSALVSNLMSKARKYSLRHRSLLESNIKIAQRTSKIKSSSKSDAFEFSRIYTMIRRQMKHQGVRVITERDGVQWEYITQAAGLVRQFATDKNLSYIDACKNYIDTALHLLKPWSINKLKMGDERIRGYYEALEKVRNDSNSRETELIYDIYQAKVAEKTGITLNYKEEQPGEYVNFIEAAKIAKEINVHPKYYVTAQFEQLDWTNGYPTPSQLASFKAKERAMKWMTENNIRVKQETRKRTKGQENFLKNWAEVIKQ